MSKQMDNIVTYAERTMEPLSEKPFGPVDSLILSWISYYHILAAQEEARSWSGIRFPDLFRAESFPALLSDVWDRESSQRLLAAMTASPRYRGIRVMGCTEQMDSAAEEQFAAVTFQVDETLSYVAFRGTDTSLVGWKEDFNMAFQYPVPSQESALRYLTEAAKHCAGEIRTGGHSKGGNLAIYAAANCGSADQGRIRKIYSHDGPGFLKSVLETDDFRAVEPKIEKTLPQSSLIGMLLEQQENYRIVKSDRLSVWQHDPFSWKVEEDDFCELDGLTPNARYLNQTLDEWIMGRTPEERERFVDSLFSLIDTEETRTWEDFRAGWKENLSAAARTFTQMDAETKKFLFQTVGALAALGVRYSPELLRVHGTALTTTERKKKAEKNGGRKNDSNDTAE